MKTISIIKLSAIAAVAAALSACGGGGGGGGSIASTPAATPATTPAAQTTPNVSNGAINASVGIISFDGASVGYGTGVASITLPVGNAFNTSFTWSYHKEGIYVLYYKNSVDQSAGRQTSVTIPYGATQATASDGSLLNFSNLSAPTDAAQAGFLSSVLGLAGSSITLGTPDLTTLPATKIINGGTTSVYAIDNDVQAAWTAGWKGQGVNIGYNGGSVDVNNAAATISARVAPSAASNANNQFDIAIGLGSTHLACPAGVTCNSLKANGLGVGSAAFIASAATANPSYTAANALAVNTTGNANEYGVASASSQNNAAAIAGGYAAIVMSKFNGLSGSQAGTVLKQTAVGATATNLGTLSLSNALAPMGKLK